MEVVLTVYGSEGYMCTFGASVAPVGCTSVVVGEVVSSAVPTDGCGAALAGRVSREAALAAQG